RRQVVSGRTATAPRPTRSSWSCFFAAGVSAPAVRSLRTPRCARSWWTRFISGSALPEEDGARPQRASEQGRNQRSEQEQAGGGARQHLHADLSQVVLVGRPLRSFLGRARLREDLFQLARGEDRGPFRGARRRGARGAIAAALLLVGGPQREFADADDVVVEDVLAADEHVVDERAVGAAQILGSVGA